MKTKLLKKIRKEFSITRYDSIATNACSEEILMAKKGFPFFLVQYVGEEGIFCNWEYVKTYDEAYAKLVKWIRDKYFEQFKHIDAKTTKVWWKKTKK